MHNLFQNHFRIKVDTSSCTSLIAGYDNKINDTWYYSNQSFESGKIYGLVSEHNQGGMYLSYLIGGRINFGDVKISCNDSPICQNDLGKASWNLEPLNELYGRKTVRKSIESAISQNQNPESFQSIADKFLLTPERFNRKIRHLSGERWRAAAAIGYAQGRKIFYAPYKPSIFYYQMCQSSLLKPLRELTAYGAVVILPTGSDEFIKHIADEVIYLNPKFDVNTLKQFYSAQYYNDSWIH